MRRWQNNGILGFQAAFQYTIYCRSGIHARHDESRHMVSGINARLTAMIFCRVLQGSLKTESIMSSQKDFLLDYIAQKYDTQPEYLWANHPEFAVFRHRKNGKWFAIVMRVSGSLIGLADTAMVDIVNVKLPPEWVAHLSGQAGFAPAYHMNKTHWLTLRLDDSLQQDEIVRLLHESFLRTL
ncbi:MmcQ/YjbR family DNA-binding protein [Wielerella bovis]|uniref:MmcQ/YjbR family DNA-binding protein n=1 Tax=Wielerella bovis TaxID=2917790 RepID=UPI0020185A8F|nr:MmcQ/YjbR family DNA-binding protein [Wielerella bovis]ULJ70260.1 MmcQ/YjbR family DNA-binding protein [Wielerella bovis]